MINYRVNFFNVNKNEEVGPTGKREVVKEYEYVGCMIIDDNGTSNDFPLAAKAYRVAPANLSRCDKLIIERV